MIKKILLIIIISLISFCMYKIYTNITIINLPEGELKWSNIRPKNAKLCIPAAFSSKTNEVEGGYMINGKSSKINNKYKISLIKDTFIINKSWKSNNGFQQIILVKDNKPIKFKNSIKKCFRRALCKKDGKAFLIESNYPMTMAKFSEYCSMYCSDAIYLDMGEYGYGYIKKCGITVPLFIWALFSKHKQTNWLYIV